MFDAWALTAALPARGPRAMWDGMHFRGEVYGWMNRALLAYICSLPPAAAQGK